MAERATVSQGVQLGVEVTPGSAVAANKLLNSLSVSPGVKVNMQNFRPTGQKYSSIITPGKEWIECKLAGVGSYSELAYLFSGILETTVASQEGATTAYTWDFTPAPRDADTIKTFTVEQGDSVRAHKFAYGLITELGLTFTRDGVDLEGTMIGQRLSDGITLTATPTAVEEKPILPTDIDVFIGDGTDQALRALKTVFKIGNRFNPIWALNSTADSFSGHVEVVPKATLELTLEADAQGMALLDVMRAGTTQFPKIVATSPDEAGVAFPYKLELDLAAKVSDVSDFSDEDGVYAITWTFDIVYDVASSKSIEAKLTNKLTTL